MMSQSGFGWRSTASMARRTISSFSCDIAYPVSRAEGVVAPGNQEAGPSLRREQAWTPPG